LGVVDGRAVIVTGGYDGKLSRFDAVSGEAIGEPLTAHSGRVWSVAIIAIAGAGAIDS
jgi:hypothetical protein